MPNVIIMNMDLVELINYIQWWVYFGILHSVLASHTIKEKIPIKGRVYRVIYNLISTAALLFVLIAQPSITALVLVGFQSSGFNLLIFLIFVVAGSLVSSLGLLQWDIPAFLGLTHDPKKLDKTGMFAFSRHPVYTGLILIFIAPLSMGISAKNLAWLCGAGGYFVFGTIFEERNLRIYFDDYSEYKNNVGRFFPWKIKHVRYFIDNLKA